MTENTNTYFFLLVIVFSSLISERRTAKLNAVSISPYTEQLYQRLRNSHRPTDHDPATESRQIRKRICQDITESGFFNEYAMEPLELTKAAVKLIHKKLPKVYKKVYVPRKNPLKRLHRPYKYKNKYAQRKLSAISYMDERHSITVTAREWVFICFLRSWFDHEEITPLYVSKEYNVFGNDSSYIAGRFIFWKNEDLILAEEPARAYVSPDHNVEVHYLQQRKSHLPAPHDLVDPVCKLARGNVRNQHHRLCTTVFRSSYFNGRILHVVPAHNDFSCLESEMSFQTTQAAERIIPDRISYHERLLPCLVVEKVNDSPTGVRRTLFYLSRAYTSYEVFVHTRTSMYDPAFLEVLITNVSVVHETTNPYFNISDDSVEQLGRSINTLNI